METAPGEVRAQAYDIVLNGYELGGGSLRIYEKELQEKMFKVLGFTQEQAQEQFGFLMDAFEYGVPPHGGLAFGLDRFIMLLAGRDNLRDTTSLLNVWILPLERIVGFQRETKWKRFLGRCFAVICQ